MGWENLGGKGAAGEWVHGVIRLHGEACKGHPDHAGLALQNREKYLLPFMSLQIMDYLLCLFTLLGSYVELPAYLKFVSRSRAVSTQPCPRPTQPGEVGGAQMVTGTPKASSWWVTFSKSPSAPEFLVLSYGSVIPSVRVPGSIK